jgi:hypothetical protein
MKSIKHLLIIILLLAGTESFAQDAAAIVGKWKIVAMHDKDIYYDFEKDSIWIKSLHGARGNKSQQYIDSAAGSMKGMLTAFLGEMTVEFKADKTCVMSEESGEASRGTYSLNEKEKILKIIEEGQAEQQDDNIKYEIKNGRLVFLPGEGDDHIIEFRKVKN